VERVALDAFDDPLLDDTQRVAAIVDALVELSGVDEVFGGEAAIAPRAARARRRRSVACDVRCIIRVCSRTREASR